MNNRPWMVAFVTLAVIVLLIGAGAAGFVAGSVYGPTLRAAGFPLPGVSGGGPVTEILESGAPGGAPAGTEELFRPFWQAWNIVLERYVDQPVDQQMLVRGAIKGMLESLGDQHTFYMEPELFKRSTEELQGQKYEGIGAWVDVTQDYLTIISPMPGSPAEKAGLKPNDKVIAVDGEDMTGVDGETVRQKVLGPKGSKVVLTILRQGMEPFDVEIIRDSIKVPTVEARMLEDQVAYIRLYTFGAETAADLKSALRDLLAQKPVGLILDLRYNGGGYLDTAIEVVSQFIGDGVVMYEEYGNGERITFEAKKGGLATRIPLVVLINEGSASASEIVAGAIQDRGRGLLVGTRSFGKGSVQTHQPLDNDQGAVSVTIARWLTPNGRQIHGQGLEPDYVVEITEADMQAGVDPQLQKAIELLVNAP